MLPLKSIHLSRFVGDVTDLREKLASIPDHICNIHRFEGNSCHKYCSHGELAPEVERCRPWLIKGSLPVAKVIAALHGHNNCRWNDLEMMTRFTHTGIGNSPYTFHSIYISGFIENFNSLSNKYCPKMYAYRYYSCLLYCPKNDNYYY